MDNDEAVRTVIAAHGYAELGMYREAWESVESLPALMRLSPPAVVVRLMVCAGRQMWSEGVEFAKIITPEFPQEVREAAGRCHLAWAELLCAGGDADGASEAVKAFMSIWPEGRRTVVNSKVWECL